MTPSADAVVVAAESEDLPAARSLPESHGAIGPGRGDPGSVGMKRKAEDPVCGKLVSLPFSHERGATPARAINSGSCCVVTAYCGAFRRSLIQATQGG